MEKVKVWWDREGNFLEVTLDQKPGYFVETATDQLMKKVDMEGRVIGFSILNVSALKDWPSPWGVELDEEEERVEGVFHRAKAVLKGHFQLTSGLHSPEYWEKLRVLQHPHLVRKLCRPIAHHFAGQGVEAVAGPTLGGVVLAYEVANQMGARALYAEREGEGRAFRQGQLLHPGERVLIVDDVLTTGGSVQQVIAAVRGVGAAVVGVAVAVDRSQAPVELGVPLFSCHRVSLPTYPPEQCPLCRAGIPLQKLGGGR